MALTTWAMQLVGQMEHAVGKEIAGAMEPALQTIHIVGAMEHVAKVGYADLTQLASITGLAVRKECAGRKLHAWIMEHVVEMDIVGAIRLMPE